MSEDFWKTTLKQEIKDGKVHYYLIKKNLITGEEMSIKTKEIKMSEEDINIIENFLNYNKEYLSVIEIASISKLLKVYREQKKVIEELNKNKQQICYEEIFTPDYVEEKFISKDKIREKIKKAKEIKWHTPKLVIEYFEELLGEN